MVLAFFLCWAPFHAQRLGYVYFKETSIFRTINEYLYYVSGFLYYLSATVNPILYNLMSLKYRHAFRQTLCGRSRTSRGRSQHQGNRSYTFRSSTRTGKIISFRHMVQKVCYKPVKVLVKIHHVDKKSSSFFWKCSIVAI